MCPLWSASLPDAAEDHWLVVIRSLTARALHLAVRPVLLGRGENLFAGLDLDALGYECTKAVAGERATHMFLHKRT